MNTIEIKWEDITLEAEYEYEPEQKGTQDSPPQSECLTVIDAKLPNGSDLFSRLSEAGIAEIEMLVRQKLEDSGADAQAETLLDSIMHRDEWEESFNRLERDAA